MSGEKVIYALLSADSAIAAKVATRIYGGNIPLNVVLPAISYSHISSTERNHSVSLNERASLTISIIEVSAHAKTYPEVKTLMASIRTACRNKQGTFNTIPVHSVVLENIGPDFANDDIGLFTQTADFSVTYRIANA